MVDLGDKRSDCEDIICKDETLNQTPKTCADCGTTKTPLWRGGPAGPKSLCNACGIRSRKKRRALMGLSNNKEDKKAKKTNNSNTSTVTTSDGSSNSEEDVNDKVGTTVKTKAGVCMESENVLQRARSSVSLQRPRSILSKKRKKLGEEEQAAMLLMALSCGSVFA